MDPKALVVVPRSSTIYGQFYGQEEAKLILERIRFAAEGAGLLHEEARSAISGCSKVIGQTTLWTSDWRDMHTGSSNRCPHRNLMVNREIFPKLLS